MLNYLESALFFLIRSLNFKSYYSISFPRSRGGYKDIYNYQKPRTIIKKERKNVFNVYYFDLNKCECSSIILESKAKSFSFSVEIYQRKY